MSKLLPTLMRLGRVGSKTDRAYAETVRHLDRITPRIELLQATEVNSSMHPTNSTGLESGELQAVDTIQNVDAAALTLNCSAAVVETNENQAEINLDPTSANFLAGISLAEPPVSCTKGRKSSKESQCAKKIKGTNNPYSTYMRSYGKKVCHTCNVTGHYNTTCPLNPNRSRAAENRKKRGLPKHKVGLREREVGQKHRGKRMKNKKGTIVRTVMATTMNLNESPRVLKIM